MNKQQAGNKGTSVTSMLPPHTVATDELTTLSQFIDLCAEAVYREALEQYDPDNYPPHLKAWAEEHRKQVTDEYEKYLLTNRSHNEK